MYPFLSGTALVQVAEALAVLVLVPVDEIVVEDIVKQTLKGDNWNEF